MKVYIITFNYCEGMDIEEVYLSRDKAINEMNRRNACDKRQEKNKDYVFKLEEHEVVE